MKRTFSKLTPAFLFSMSAVLMAGLFLSACSGSKHHITAPKSFHTRHKNTAVIIAACDQKLDPIIQESGMSDFTGLALLSLVDMAIDAKRKSDANAELKPIHDELANLDVQQLLKDAIEKNGAGAATKTTWFGNLTLNAISANKGSKPAVTKRHIIKTCNPDLVMDVVFKYGLDGNFHVLSGTLDVEVKTHNYNSKDYKKGHVVFRTNMVANRFLEEPGKTRAENASLWGEQKALRFKAALINIIQDLAVSLKRKMDNADRYEMLIDGSYKH